MKNFRSILSSKIFIAFLFTALGASGTVLAQTIIEHKKQARDPFAKIDEALEENHKKILAEFGNDEIPKDLQEMQKRMDETFRNNQQLIQEAIRSAENGDSKAAKINASSKEDEKNYYYEISFTDVKKEDVIVEIKNNNLTFRAQTKQEIQGKKGLSTKNLNFYYSFFIPQYDEKQEPEIAREEGKIVVKLKKISKSNN